MKDSNHDAIQVLIADNQPVVRLGVTSMLQPLDDIVVVGEAADLEETLHLMQNLKPDVTLLDIAAGDTYGIGSVERVRETLPDARIVVYTAFRKLDLAIQVLELGVQGYLLKESQHPGIATVIRIVHAGGTFVDPVISRELVRRHKNRHQYEAPLGLTEREQEVLRLVAKGVRNRIIAERLFITERTVKFHMSSILAKLGARNRTEAVRIAARSDVFHDEEAYPN